MKKQKNKKLKNQKNKKDKQQKENNDERNEKTKLHPTLNIMKMNQLTQQDAKQTNTICQPTKSAPPTTNKHKLQTTTQRSLTSNESQLTPTQVHPTFPISNSFVRLDE
ncbi:Hypothetical_protein [Hexamita inflata]|uniref:Hypothetical_protein n=1 Tax=Hexamita inflata TaxID=28002 RepID=A0AA86R0L0_9EUKA|nr:Hypothetical protein HINF_LOCUS51742 [Hexamita inflata]